MEYIDYENKLLKEIKVRRERIQRTEKRTEIEYAIKKRIDKLYQIVISYFKNELNLWFMYLEFCKDANFIGKASQVLKELLQV